MADTTIPRKRPRRDLDQDGLPVMVLPTNCHTPTLREVDMDRPTLGLQLEDKPMGNILSIGKMAPANHRSEQWPQW